MNLLNVNICYQLTPWYLPLSLSLRSYNADGQPLSTGISPGAPGPREAFPSPLLPPGQRSWPGPPREAIAHFEELLCSVLAALLQTLRGFLLPLKGATAPVKVRGAKLGEGASINLRSCFVACWLLLQKLCGFLLPLKGATAPVKVRSA
jgi:hypothetical protein